MQVVLSVTSKCWMQNVPSSLRSKPFSILPIPDRLTKLICLPRWVAVG
nr:Cation efflux system protein CusC precursor [Klebsiella pneumoniae]